MGLKSDIDVNAYAELIRENLEIDHLIANNPFDAEMLQGIYELVLETVVCQRDIIVIEGTGLVTYWYYMQTNWKFSITNVKLMKIKEKSWQIMEYRIL